VSGTLYVVATPIGNLADLSPRASEVLRAVQAVAAEDTRRTMRLFAHLGVPPPPMISLPAFDERGRVGAIVSRLVGGADVALCTDAGTPGISDPGEALVAAAWEAGVRVVPVPGPCAAIAAVSVSGLPAARFLFAGFLPRKGGGRSEALAELAGVRAAIVLHEAGNRLSGTLADLRVALGDRRALVARELSKLHEELARGNLSELAGRFADEVRGEVTIVVEAPGAPAAPVIVEEDLDEELRRRTAAGERATAIARDVARAKGIPRADVYARIQRLKDDAT
jgi:16S rRNA (cytidine1402-2'-O)-methyltransferase